MRRTGPRGSSRAGHGGVSSCARESVLSGVGRDCGVVAGGPSPARWPGPAGGRVGVLGCHGTALVLEALGGGTPCALAADLGPWKAPLRVPCAPSRRPAVLFPRGCSGFQRLCPLPPSRCLAASPRLPADPVPRPGALVLLRPVAASHPCLSPPARRWCRVRTRDHSSRPPPCAAPPPLRRACPGVGRVPAGRRGRCGRALPPPGVGAGSGSGPAPLAPRERAPARPGPAVAGRCPGPARAPPSGPPRCVCVGGGWSVPRLSAPPLPVCPRPRWRGPASQPRSPLRVGVGRGEWGASSRSPPLRAPALRGVVAAAAAAAACAPRAWHVRPTGRPCAAPLLGGAGCLWLTALLPG